MYQFMFHLPFQAC